ncbi:MAG: hypothetical protein DPW09_13810 [Anaerolineae bacterium]|nr:N-acetylmuramoyl-L-alanine amidase [Anaerolineales bacterium]MCQ3974513.1 hypothetical protein [Anaerolineae bacterium]
MYGLNIDPNNPTGDPDPSELKQLGVEMVRYTFYDRSGGDQVDPARIDFYSRKAKGYRDVGIGSLIILTYDTYPGKPPFANNWDDYINRFARRAGQIAQQLAPFRPAYQIWNEPDHDRIAVGKSYDPCLREEVFGQMLRRTRDAIKAADPQALIVAGGLASGNPSWLSTVIKSQGGDLTADIVAFHPYAQRPEPNWPSPTWANASPIGDLIAGYHRVVPKKILWITEMGSKPNEVPGGDEGSAEFLRRYYRAIITQYSDKVQELFWFCYSDGMVSPFGLKQANGTPKPAYEAFRQAVDARSKWQPEPAVAAPPQPVTPPPPPPPVAAPPPPSPTSPVTPPPAPPPTSPVPLSPLPTAPAQDLSQLIVQTSSLQSLVQQLQTQLAQLQTQVQQLSGQQSQLQAQMQQLLASPPTSSPPPLLPPPIQNITDQLKRHPSQQFQTRSLEQIQMVIIHHTAVAPTVGAERIAEHRVDKQGWPGIGYHYFITADGQIQQTNELTTVATHAGNYNPIAIGVCFAGDFTATIPSPEQIKAGAQLIAWLIQQRQLSLASVFGYKELINTQSPGLQWDSGARWGDQLRAEIEALL